MDFLNWLYHAIGWFVGVRVLFLALPVILIAYFVFGKKDELGWHAIQNSAATIVVVGINLSVAFLFFREINAFAQAAYDAIGIPTLPAETWAETPLWIVCVLGIVAKDFVDYWTHRAMHRKWLWPTHAAHHSDTYVNAFTTFRVHFLETIVMTTSYIITLTWLQMPHVIPLVAFLAAVHNMYVHTDLGYEHGPLKYLIASPAFHRWHHADVPEAHGKNLANVMPIYDLVFGTYYYPHRCTEEMGALKSGVEDKDPILIWTYPFRKWGQMLCRRMPMAVEAIRKLQRGATPAE